MVGVSDRSPLRQVLDQTIATEGGSLKDLTVLAPQNDPFRVDTDARHRDGEWLAVTARDLGLGDRKIHLRGLALHGARSAEAEWPAIHEHR